ncbi:MAG: hypothetical protein H6Q87_1326, partial [candidate division NC10 bacterium]|nr:hypothetical protein [candidate division NC10 bacterium]
MRLRRFHFPLLVAGAVWWLQSGCESGPSPEQLRADSVMVAALAANDAGELPSARAQLLEAIEAQRHYGRPENIATMLEALAGSYAIVGEVDSALAYLNRTIEVRRSLADRAAIRGLTLQIAGLHRRMGDDRRAMDIYIETLRLARLFKDQNGVREVLRAMLPSYRALDDADGERLAIADLSESATA